MMNFPKLARYLIMAGFSLAFTFIAEAQVMTQTFNSTSLPSGWSQSNSCNSTSTNAYWRMTTSNPGYSASGYTDHTGSTGSYAMWVDGSSPYPCDVSITTDSIDVSTLTTPSIEFYWFRDNYNPTSYPGGNKLYVDVFDGQSYTRVWTGDSDSSGWRKATVDISCLTLNNDIALRFTVEKQNGTVSFYTDIIVDDIKVQELPSGYSGCAAPTAIAVTNISSTATATVTEACNSSATTTLIYGLAGFNPSSGGSSVTVSSGSATLSSLVGSSTYDVYAVTACSSTSYSDTLGPISFATPCGAVTTPFTENFDAGSSGNYVTPSLPNCWEYYSNGTYPYWYVRNYSTYANSGSQMVYGYKSSGTPNGSSYGDTAFFTTPPIQGLDSATKMVEFYGRTSSTSYLGMVLVGVTDANATPSSFKIVDTLYTNTAYQKYTVYLDNASGITSGDSRVAFAWLWDNSLSPAYDYVYIDDITIKDIPPCPEPISLSLTATTQTSATIAWSSSSSAFNIEVGPTGFTQGTGTSFTSTTTSYTATGLTQNTYYDAYVMSNCTATGDGTSNWVGPFTFKTECGDLAAPYSTGFELQTAGSTSNPDLPDCWNYLKTGTSTSFYSYVYNSTSYSKTGSKSLRFYGYASSSSSNSAEGDTLAAMSPRIAGMGNGDKQVLFSVRSTGTVAYYNNKLIIATADSSGSKSSINIIDTISYNGTYVDYTIDLVNVQSSASRVVFMIVPELVSGYTYSYTYAYVDDIEIRDIPACPEASDIVGTATSDTSFTFSWSDSSTVSQYVIEWGPTGFTQGTGIPYDSVNGTSWSIDTLTSNTTYDLYIQSICPSQGMNSPWYGPVTVTTPCSPNQLPFYDGFENLATTYGTQSDPNLSECWVIDRGDASSYVRGMSNSYGANSGNGYMEFWGVAQNSDTVVLSSPSILGLDTGGVVVSFYGRVNSTNYLGELELGVSSLLGEIENTRALQEFELSTSYEEYKLYLDSTLTKSGDSRVSFIFPEGSGTFNDIRIDDFRVEAIPSCLSFNHNVSNISSSGATLNWSYTGTNCFNLQYGPSGFTQATGNGITLSSISSPYNLNGIKSNTTYDFYVQNCCSNQWEGPFSFTTECTGPLSGGVYTVGNTGSFETIDSAFTVLNNCGISGPVTFQLLSGYHVPSVELGAVNGSSASNTITIKGSANATDTLRNVVFNGTSHLTLSDLAIKSNGGYAIRLNGTSHINITGNTIISPQSSSSSVIGIVASESSTSYSSGTEGETYLTISDNDIQGGYFAINLYGNSSYLNTNISITNNTITDAYYYGLYIYYARDVEVSDNTITDFSNTYNYGAYLYQLDGGLVTRNEFNSYYSILAYYFSTTSEASIQSEISNNMFYGGYYGMRVYYGSNLKVYHNSVVGSYYGMYDYNNGSDVDIRNNIIQGGTYSLYSYYSSASRDYNLYYSLGSTLGYINNGSTNYPSDLSSLKAIDSNKDQNSLSGDPIFVSSTDLHATGVLPHNNGDDSATVSLDIDGETRPSGLHPNPDIGADEYEIFTNQNFSQVLDTSICFGDSITLSTAYVNSTTNLWTSGESGQSITVVANSDSAAYTIQTSSDSVRLEQFIVRAYDLPEVYLSVTGSHTICYDDTLSVNALGSAGQYSWNQGSSSQSISLNTPGSYWLSVTDLNGCSSSSDTLTLNHYMMLDTDLKSGDFDSTFVDNNSSGSVAIGTAPNVYGAGFSPRTNLWVDPSSKSLVFIHRSNYSSNGDNSSGSLRIDYSQDAGDNWSYNMGPIWDPSVSGYAYPGAARYPHVSMVSPPNNTNPGQNEIAVWAPTLSGNQSNGWGGALYGTYSISDSSADMNVDTSYGYVTLGNMYSSGNKTWSVGTHSLNGNTYYYKDTMVVFRGEKDFVQDSYSVQKEVIQFPLTNATSTNKYMSNPKIFFSSDQKTGYISVLAYDSLALQGKTITPRIVKSIDGGKNWGMVSGPVLKNLIDITSGDSLMDIIQTNYSSQSFTNLMTVTASGHDLTVDALGNPHILVNVFAKSNADFSYYPSSNHLVDIFSEDGGISWKCMVIDQVANFGYAFDVTNGPVTEYNRPHTTLSEDRSTIFYSWFESNPSFVSGTDNQFPDWKISARHILADTLIIDDLSVGTAGDHTWGNVADFVTSDSAGHHRVHMTYAPIDDFSTFSVLSPIDFYYQNIDLTIESTSLLGDTMSICFGDTLQISASDLSVTTIWNTGDTNQYLNASQSGLYWAKIIGANGCEFLTDTVYVQVDAPIQDSILSSSLAMACIGDTVQLSLPSNALNSYTWNTGDTTSAISALTPGEYYAAVTNSNGCISTTDTVTVMNYANPSDTIWASSATTFCDGNTVLLSVSNNSVYSWNTGDSTQNVSIGASGSYWAEVTDSNGCSVQTDTIAVTVNPLPVEVITNVGSSVYCDGDSTVLSLTGQNTYQWSTGATTDDISVFTSGDYFAMLTDSNGCQNYSDTVAITVNALPSDSLVVSGNTEFCDGDSVIVGALSNVSYLWSTGDTTQQVVVSNTSAITGVVTDANGCIRQLDTAHITVNPLPNDSIYAAGPTTFCLGDSVVIVSADAGAMHLWNTLDTSSSIVANASGMYYVGLVSDKGCISASDTIDVVVNPNPNPTVTINGSLDLCPGDSVTLSGNSGLTYSWSTGDSTQSITVGQSASIVLDVTNSFGCSATSSTQDVILHPFPSTSQILGDTVGIVPLTQYTYVVSQTPGNTYQWTAVNGAIVAGQGTNIATVMWTQDTTGSLTVVESNGYCNDTASIQIRTNIGIEDIVRSNIKLYPNPTQGRLIVQGEEALGDYVIYNMTGAIVASGRTENWEIQLDLSNYPSGVYWLNVAGNRFRVVLLD